MIPLLWSFFSAQVESREEKTPAGAVLLELFTSEGCSSCPPADDLLWELASRPHAPAELIALSFHVDYWNHLGWKDPYSSEESSRRQRRYAKCLGEKSVYTPQLIVDGSSALVGSDREGILSAIESSAMESKSTIRLSPAAASHRSAGYTSVRVRVEPPGGSAEDRAALFVALVEDRLASNVTRGENAGRRLEHTGVVRWMSSLDGWSEPDSEAVARIPLESGWDRGRSSVVAWLQELPCGRVLGARRIDIAYLDPP